MCVPCFLAILFLIYAIIGIITGSIFNYNYIWKVDLGISSEKFGACWPKYIPILISELKAEKKQSNRNIVLYTLHDIECEKTNVDKNSNFIKNFKPNCYLEFKGKQYMADINGNILPLKLD